MTNACPDLNQYWTLTPDEIARQLESGSHGLSSAEAAARLRQYGRNAVRDRGQVSRLHTLLDQLRSPLLLLLIFAAAASGMTREWIDASIVLAIVLATWTIHLTTPFWTPVGRTCRRL
jgi:P-type Mg2+ transporter